MKFSLDDNLPEKLELTISPSPAAKPTLIQTYLDQLAETYSPSIEENKEYFRRFIPEENSTEHLLSLRLEPTSSPRIRTRNSIVEPDFTQINADQLRTVYSPSIEFSIEENREYFKRFTPEGNPS
jgi:hypothetical protein